MTNLALALHPFGREQCFCVVRASRYTDGVLTRSEFDAGHDEEFFASLPASPAVFVLRPNRAGAEPYVSKTVNLRRRLQRLLAAAEGRRLSLRERVSAAEWCEVGGDFEAGFALYRLLRRSFQRSTPSGCTCVRRRWCNCCGRIPIRGLR